MAAAAHPDRRTLLIASASVAATSVLAPVADAVDRVASGAIVVFEADEPAARAFARGRGDALAMDGDRIRFARWLFGETRPRKVLGMTRYADFVILAESAREYGYRATLEGPVPPAGAALFVWAAELKRTDLKGPTTTS